MFGGFYGYEVRPLGSKCIITVSWFLAVLLPFSYSVLRFVCVSRVFRVVSYIFTCDVLFLFCSG